MALLQTGPDLAMHLRGLADGALFMAQSALALAAALSTVLAVAPGGARQGLLAAITFVVAAAAAASAPQDLAAGALVPGALLTAGVLVAAGVRLRATAAWIALVLGGAVAGVAGGLQTATWDEMAGGLLVLFVSTLAGFQVAARVEVPERFRRGVSTARRAAGAWIAAVAILLLALWMRRGG